MFTHNPAFYSLHNVFKVIIYASLFYSYFNFLNKNVVLSGLFFWGHYTLYNISSKSSFKNQMHKHYSVYIFSLMLNSLENIKSLLKLSLFQKSKKEF